MRSNFVLTSNTKLPNMAQSRKAAKPVPVVTNGSNINRESFDNIYLDLSKESGKCRFAESGLGWKPSGGGDTYTLDSSNFGGAQWSRAAKGYEVKILLRSSGVVQLDGFTQEVRFLWSATGAKADRDRIKSASPSSSRTGTARIWSLRSTLCEGGTGARANSARQNLLSLYRTDLLSKYHTPRS